MAEVLFRQVALRDLEQIGRRIALEDPAAAQRFRKAAIRRIGLLRHFPESAQPRPEFDLTSGRYRLAVTL